MSGKCLCALKINTLATWKQKSAMLNRNKTSRNGACPIAIVTVPKKRFKTCPFLFVCSPSIAVKRQIIAETAGLMKAQNQGISSLRPGWLSRERVPPFISLNLSLWKNKGHVRIKRYRYIIYYALGLPITFSTVDSCELQQVNTISCLVPHLSGEGC